MLKFIVTLALIMAVDSARVNFKPCPNGAPQPEWIESDYCTTEKCTLTRGLTFTGRASVIPQEPFSKLIIEITGSLLGLTFPIDIPAGYEDACHFLEGESCPIVPNKNYIWGMQAPIAKTYPAAQGVQMKSKLNQF